MTSASILILRAVGFAFCEVWRNVLYRAGVGRLETLLGINIYLCFFVDEGGSLRGCSLVLTSASVFILRSGGVWFCEVWRNVLYRAGVDRLETCLLL